MASSPLRIGGSTFSFIWREPAASALERMLEIGLNDFDALIVGRGTVNVAAAVEAINAIGFSGVTVLEVISPAPIAEMGASLTLLAAARRDSGLRPEPSSARDLAER